MKGLGRLASLLFLANATARAGVGVWTSNGPADFQPSSRVVADSMISGTLYAATGTGMAKSVDDGSTWFAVGSIAGQPINPLAASNGRVYASVVQCEPPVFLSCSNSVYASGDGGNQWQVLFREDYQGTLEFGITVDPVTPSTLYRTSTSIDLHSFSGSSLDRSTDGGHTWTTLGSGDVITAFVIDPRNPATLYVARVPTGHVPVPPPPSQLLKSTDAGATWTLLTLDLPVAGLVLDPLTPTSLYATTASGVYRTTDGGATFAVISQTELQSLVIDPRHPRHLYGDDGNHGIFASSDAGVTWTPLNEGLPGAPAWVYSLVIDPSGAQLHATTVAPGVWDLQVVPDPGELTLDATHPFSVTLTATDQRTGRTGPGVASQVNDLWGYFSIPAITGNPNNPEVFVKMLNGTALNGNYWFFHGGLTDLEYTLTVTEVATGRQKTYTKPAGSECGGSDTAAFGP